MASQGAAPKTTIYVGGVPYTGSSPERAQALAAKDYPSGLPQVSYAAPTVYGAGGKVVSGPTPQQQAQSNFQTGQQTDATVGGTAPNAGTLTAQIGTPKSANSTVAPPPVVTSASAEKDLANKKAQTDQLQTDTAAHQQMVNAPQPAPQQDQKDTSQTPQSEQPQTLDEQISELLGGLNSSDQNIDTQTQAQISPLQQQQQKLDTQLASDAKSALAKLDQISTGTYPLSPAEQNLISATKSTFLATISAQTTANSAFQGQLAETMASLGIETSAPTQAAGLMFSAISSGNEKVANLNAQMSQAIAQLQLGFQKEDYSEVSDAWDKTSKYLNDRINTITDMQKSILDAAKQYKQDAKDYTTLALDYVVKSADFDYKQKQDVIDNAFKQAQISETQRHDLQTEAVSWANEKRLDKANTPGGGGTFTSTQLNHGAANANMDVGAFRALDANDKNYFINNYTAFEDAVKKVNSGDATRQDLTDAINAANISDTAKQTLEDKADSQISSDTSSSGSGLWGVVKGVLGI